MTRTQRILYQRRYLLWITAALLALGGGLAVAFLQIGRAEARAGDLATEADRRGDAVSTLAGDVRTLRAQIRARGETPAAPDPAQAIEDLPARAEVPVPIPGPPGPAGKDGVGKDGEDGKDGRNGKDGATPSPVPGPSGAEGRPGADSAVPGPAGHAGPAGPAGPPGPAGKDGRDGKDGAPGQTCPVGYTLQPPPGDPDALVCRRTSTTPETPDSPSPSPTVLGLPPERRRP
ncbi:collagen-like protein [Streptomyces sp. NPDC088124]|uniref:collagen-like protein n=1 Tax=Streptomyces sp. NPDC088124 TaxID=3154654 RepID=UPI003420F700